MTTLDGWLAKATRQLSRDSSAQVRAEIHEHYESARDAAISDGTNADEADRLALIALGDPKTANCQYRKVMLTSSEARILREANWEARAVCSRPWLKWMLLSIPGVALMAASVLFSTGSIALAQTLLVGGIVTAIGFAGPFLPVYTPSRSRMYRGIKLAALMATLVLAFWPDVLKWSWLLFSCLWVLIWIEWTRVSIRRKLPVAQWPKQLYL